MGRWLTVDPKREFFSPYVGMGNNPVNKIDPSGGCTNCPDETVASGTWKNGNETYNYGEGDPNGITVGSLREFGWEYVEGTTYPSSVDTSTPYNYAVSKLPEGISKDLFDVYWLGGGSYTLFNSQFRDIAKSIASLPPPKVLDPVVGTDGTMITPKQYSFYSNKKYARALGTATIYFDKQDNPVGLRDDYDFDPKPWGERSVKNEIITRGVDYFGREHGAKPFPVTYGITPR